MGGSEIRTASLNNDPTFPTADVVYLKKETHLAVRLVRGQLVLTENHELERQLFNNLQRHAAGEVYYSDFSPIHHIEAQTLIQNKKRTKSISVDRYETEDVVQPGIFYGGYKRKKFVYPSLTVGAITSLKYSQSVIDPHIISPFYFNDQFPVLHSEFSVVCDKDIELGYKLFGTAEVEVNFHREIDGDEIKYTWSTENAPAFVHELRAPSRTVLSPHIVVYIKSYHYQNQTHQVLSDVADLYHWYSQLVNKINDQTDKNRLKQTVSQVTASASDRADKIRLIFQWVQENIKYVAFEDGMAGFIPRAAEDIYSKRYGDCKDMANLLKEMLAIAGIESHLTWIGTRDKPYSYLDVPTTVADNHMICTVNVEGESLFLDATSAHVPFGLPTSMIQGKEALVALEQDNYMVLQVPVVPRQQNLRQDSIVLTLTSQALTGTNRSTLMGYRKERFAYGQMRAATNNDQDFLRNYFDVGANNVAINRIETRTPTSLGNGLQVSFHFTLPNYTRQIGKQWYVNLNLHKSLPGEIIECETRKYPVEYDFRFEDRQTIVLPIPEGFSLSHVPEDQAFDHPDFGFSTRYLVKQDRIILQKNLYINKLVYQSDQFSDWNALLRQLTQANQASIILTSHQ